MPRLGMHTIASISTPTRLVAFPAFIILGALAVESHAVELCGVAKVQSGESGLTVTLQGWNQGASFAVYRTDDKERKAPLRASPLQGKFVLHDGESAAFPVGIHGGCVITGTVRVSSPQNERGKCNHSHLATRLLAKSAA